MKILIIVPDGVGVRNYLYSNFANYLNDDNHEIIIYHKISVSAIEEIQKEKPFLTNFDEIPLFIENFKARLLRESLAYARLLRNEKKLKNKSILMFWSPSKKGWKKKVLYFFSELFGFFLSKKYSRITKVDNYFEKEIAKSKVCKEITLKLKKIKPDFVFNLNQKSPLATPIIIASKEAGIKNGTVIISWDNVPKARLITRYDNYFVWSELMQKEICLLYPEIKSSQIKIVGTPQFEFYSDPKFKIEKEIFFKKFGLDIHKKTICFSGNDIGSPYEANYFNDICEEINKIDKNNRPQILFRKCPVDLSTRFDDILTIHKNNIVSIDPDWKIDRDKEKSFISIYPNFNDISLLVNTVIHSDIVINLGSTMAHDFAVLNKPCLYLNYNPVENSTFKVKDVYDFQHFKSLKDINAVGFINSKNEIKQKIIKALNSPERIGEDRKKWLKRIILHPLENNSRKLLNDILSNL